MTQEVQPLTWQKRTNLEEHQQFFSKINEIIANLAPTVNEAEQAIAQATQAIASANAAIATANAASASADAASQQAQTAADTVAGYNTRLIAVEDEASGNTSNIIDLQDRMGTAESKNIQQDSAITALQTADGQNVKIAGAQNIAGIKTVPTEATGTRSQQIANSAKVGAELDAYGQMVRTTGNQTIGGEKTFTGYLIHPFQKRDFAVSQSSNTPWIKLIEYPTSRRQIRGRVESTSGKAFFIVDNSSNTSPIVRLGGWGLPADSVAFTYNDGDSKVGLWFKVSNYESIKIYIDDIGNYSGSDSWSYLTIVSSQEYKTLPEGDHITYSSAWTVIQ